MSVYEGLLWRYKVYLEPHLLLDLNMFSAIARRYNNSILMRSERPICYIYADACNIGDRVSALGVQQLVGKRGVELFASKAGLPSTIKILNWLQINRPNTMVIVGGGGLLQECFTAFWTQLIESTLSFSLFGVGANEMQGKRKLLSVSILRDLAFRATAIHVRDMWTRDLLQFGQTAQVTIGICPAVNYLVSKYSCNLNESKKYLLHVQHPVDISLSGGDPKHISSILKSIAIELGLIYDETDHIKDNLDTLAVRYKRSRFVVSSRLHGCIFSYAFKIPFVPIISDKKTSAFIMSHLPENPTIDAKFTKNEVFEKLFIAEKQMYAYGNTLVDSALCNNVRVMHKINIQNKIDDK